MGVTLKDVANYCGVSIATVSLVLNDPTKNFSQQTREKVLAAVNKLGYVPNLAARSMVTNKTKTIGLLITNADDNFFTEILRGVTDSLSSRGYDLLIGTTNSSLEREQEYIRIFEARSVDGLIFTPLNTAEANEAFTPLIARKVPFVTIERYLKESSVPSVKMNNFQAAYDMTVSFLERGHRRIALITGPMVVESSRNRLEGYKAALKSYGIEYDESIVFNGDFSYESGVAAGNDILNSAVNEITGILSMNNSMAYGAYQSLEEAGYSIPENISIAGLGGTRMPPVFRPKLTTVEIPTYDMGVNAGNMVLDVIEKGSCEESHRLFDNPIIDCGSVIDVKNQTRKS